MKKGSKHSKETIEKMKGNKNASGHLCSEDTKAKQSILAKKRIQKYPQTIFQKGHPCYNNTQTEETKKKISKAMQGGNNTSFKKGHKMSNVVKQKIHETMKGIMPKNIEQIKGWNKGLYGENSSNWQGENLLNPIPQNLTTELKNKSENEIIILVRNVIIQKNS